ncbi:unnamed protein product [Musa acuminata subsp. malaccensis]|uniref:(wild Malaysian banana) hypothetical protein n=1 Tax=Musa acuminata subsp. malaccensis TaxID=214687 RepID=A0A804J4M4_MUSAM|nr:PREDICTED: autophagy-related protein 13a [Musa acuminata subsp. malaccensis]CAG1838549.1 unnamed protein product [Musa acuminata subsp. malaccensis]
MASPSESDRKIITRFLHKTLHAVVASRVPRLHHAAAAGPASPKNDRWFHLALDDHPSPADHHGAVVDPLVFDILLTRRGCSDVIVERWTARCVPPVPWSAASPHHPHDGSFLRRTYKKCTILLRSIYTLLRLLPVHRIFRLLCSSSQPYNYDLCHKVLSFAAPFSRAQEAELKQYSFAPVETMLGHLVVSVQYRPSLTNFNLEVSLPTPPLIITDYVGSPAADPMRPFPSSLPDRMSHPIVYQYPPRGIRTLAAPSFDRPHSWNSASMVHHHLSSAPGPPDSELLPGHYGHLVPNQRSSMERKGSSGFGEFKLSPPCSTSPSPSPPTRVGNSQLSRLHSETSPVSIPLPATENNQMHRSPNFSDPFKSLFPPPSPRSTRTDLSFRESPSKSISFRKPDGFSLGDIHSNLHMHAAYKVIKDGRDDSGRFSALSSGGSPGYGFSSSSRQSIQDDLDDEDFSYPFAFDDVDTSDSQTRSLDGKEASENSGSHKSQEAAVGILVHMLKTAAPLRQDQSCSMQSLEPNGEASISSSVMSRKACDALEELQSYKEMKNLLLSKSGAKLQDSVKQRKESSEALS